MIPHKYRWLTAIAILALGACSKSVSVKEEENDPLSQTAGVFSIITYSSGAFPIAGSSANQDLLNQMSVAGPQSSGLSLPTLSSGMALSSVVANSSGAIASSQAPLSSGAVVPSSIAGTSSNNGASSIVGTSSQNGVSSAQAPSSASLGIALTNVHVLTNLNSIQVPATSTQGVHLTQFQNDGTLGVLAVTWEGQSQWIHTVMGLKYAFTTGSDSHRGTLLDQGTSWPLYADVVNAMGDGSNRYKENLTSNAQGMYWVDYGVVERGGSGGNGGSGTGGTGTGGTSSSTVGVIAGKIYFQPWSGGTTSVLTDSIPYRTRLDASGTHLAWVEYAPGATIGQIKYMNLVTKQITLATSSSHHQDRPAIDGDYLVWEEYLDASNAVIRSLQLSTGTVRDISSNVGFRTNPDILAGRAIWEDQRTGNGDLWYHDLIRGTTEQLLVSGVGHSAGVRLYKDKVVWIESNGTAMGLVVGTW